MSFMNFNGANNAFAQLNLALADTDVTCVLKGKYDRFPTANFIIKVTKTVSGVVTARENIYVATRAGATCAGLIRAYEPVPIDDDATTNIQQALDFDADDLVEVVISNKFLEDMQENLASKEGVQNQEDIYAVDSGVANAYIVTLDPVPTAYVSGQRFVFKATNSNSGASTLNVNGLGVKSIKKISGVTALASGDIVSGKIVDVIYNGTDFELQTPTAPEITTRTYGMGESCSAGDALTTERYMHPLACDSQITFGNAVATQKLVFRVMGNGVSMASLLVGLKKVGTPTDNVVLAIQADVAGSPSGVDLQTASVSGGSMTTTSAQYTPSLGGAISPTDRTWYWVEVRRDGALDASNYYQIAVHTDDTIAFPYKVYNAGSYGANTLTETHSIAGAGFYQDVAVRAKATVWKFARVRLYAPSALSALAPVSEALNDTYSGLSSLQPGKGYYLSDTPGAISLTAGTIKTSAGMAVNSSGVIILPSKVPLTLTITSGGGDPTGSYYSNPVFVERGGVAEMRANGTSGFNNGGTGYLEYSTDLASWNQYGPTSSSSGATWTGTYVAVPFHGGVWVRARLTVTQSSATNTAILYT